MIYVLLAKQLKISEAFKKPKHRFFFFFFLSYGDAIAHIWDRIKNFWVKLHENSYPPNSGEK